MNSEEEIKFKQSKIEEKYVKLNWSSDEKCVRQRSKFKLPRSDENRVPLSLALRFKIKSSCFGRFMKTFNDSPVQNIQVNIDKLGIEEWNIKHFNKREQLQWDYDHNFAEDLFDFLKTAVHTKDCIDYDYFYDNLTCLRLMDCQINYVDTMKRFANLLVLILAGNWITNIDGKKLPAKLEFLECFMNQISNIAALCENTPKRIKHLGFGRNKLTNDSNIHLLVDSGSFTELHTLDLSQNDIVDFIDLLEQLVGLQRLIALSLEGNPCYVCDSYKETVLSFFPKLIYLDETQILDEDKENVEGKVHQEKIHNSGLIFTCYRLIGIPMPPKGANIIHTFHLAIEAPLLEEIKLPLKEIKETKTSVTEETPKETEVKGEGKENKKGKDAKAKPKTDKPIKIPKAVKGKGLYALPDDDGSETDDSLKSFKTEEREWDPVIKFNNPALIIHTPDNNLQLLRDTFRSRIKVKIVYSQKFMEKPEKTEKGKQGNKEGGNTDGIILKRCTFATFYCNLKSVNWSDQYVDFIWADFPEIGSKAQRVEGSLKPEVYSDKAQSKETRSEKSDTSQKNASTVNKLPLPTTLTCHVGFGLKRLGQIQELVATKKGKNK